MDLASGVYLHGMWRKNIVEAIGQTPLVRLNRIARAFPCTVLAKLEAFNPGGSTKDRIAAFMVQEAERDGRLRTGGVVVEATSGNTGVGVAMVARAKGYRCLLAVTNKLSQEKLDLLRAFGAEVTVCPKEAAPEDPKSYYNTARRLAEETPGGVYLNQYYNRANLRAHYHTTGPEIWKHTQEQVTHVFAAASTGGTISGVAHYLKEQNPDVQVVGVDPCGSVYHRYFHEGQVDPEDVHPYQIEGAGKGFVAGNFDVDVIDDYVRVEDRESMRCARRLVEEEGILTGQSGGLAIAGALQWLHAHHSTIKSRHVVVIILADSGNRYLTKTFNDDWMRSQNLL